MAEATARRVGYPVIPAKNWWELRKRFQSNLPRKIDADYLQSVLSVEAPWAKQLASYLAAFGLIDDQGKPEELANDWRHDDEYPVVCQTIMEKVFPEALRDAYPCSAADRKGVTGWFTRNARLGEGAAARASAFYMMLCEADPSKQDRPAAAAQPTPPPPPPTNGQVEEPPPAPARQLEREPGRVSWPSDLHINVQIHIAADAGAEQIDTIFASMAKHLRSLRSDS
jgi:hypothetical protein